MSLRRLCTHLWHFGKCYVTYQHDNGSANRSLSVTYVPSTFGPDSPTASISEAYCNMATLGLAKLEGLLPSVILVTLLGYASLLAYRIFLHPLSKFPGPRAAAISRSWQEKLIKSGRAEEEYEQLHKLYRTYGRKPFTQSSLLTGSRVRQRHKRFGPAPMSFTYQTSVFTRLCMAKTVFS